MGSKPEVDFVIRPGQELTAEHYEPLIEAIYQKNPTAVSNLLGQGLDLSPPGGRANAMLALAMLRDHDPGKYVINPLLAVSDTRAQPRVLHI